MSCEQICRQSAQSANLVVQIEINQNNLWAKNRFVENKSSHIYEHDTILRRPYLLTLQSIFYRFQITFKRKEKKRKTK